MALPERLSNEGALSLDPGPNSIDPALVLEGGVLIPKVVTFFPTIGVELVDINQSTGVITLFNTTVDPIVVRWFAMFPYSIQYQPTPVMPN